MNSVGHIPVIYRDLQLALSYKKMVDNQKGAKVIKDDCVLGRVNYTIDQQWKINLANLTFQVIEMSK